MVEFNFIKIVDEFLKKDFVLLDCILAFFVFIASGYFIRGFLFGFYDLEKELISTLALSCFIFLPPFIAEYKKHKRVVLIEFWEEKRKHPDDESCEEMHKKVVTETLLRCSTYAWIIILLFSVNKFLYTHIQEALISRIIFLSGICAIFLSVSISGFITASKKLEKYREESQKEKT
ncbi:MAG: hypothetical protein ABH851_04310 [Methanobacteriota archaeon]